MSFLRKLFGSGEPTRPRDEDSEGFFVYVQCDNCGQALRLRIHKHHDLNYAEDGYVWHKTIVDSRCFRPMTTVAYFDSRYQLTKAEIEGGRFISQAEFEAHKASRAGDKDVPAE